MRLPAKLTSFYLNRYSPMSKGLHKRKGEVNFTKIHTAGTVEATIKSSDYTSLGFLTTLIDDVTSVSLIAKTLPKAKPGVSVSMNVSPSLKLSEKTNEQQLIVSSNVINIENRLATVKCVIKDSDDNILAHGTHTKYLK